MDIKLIALALLALILSACSGGDSDNSANTTNSTESLTTVTATVNTSDLPSAVAAKAASVISLSDSIDFQQAVSGSSLSHTQGRPTIIVSDSGDILMMTTESNNGVLDFTAESTAISLAKIMLNPNDYGTTEDVLLETIKSSTNLSTLVDKVQQAINSGSPLLPNIDIEQALADLIREVGSSILSTPSASNLPSAALIAPFGEVGKNGLPFDLVQHNTSLSSIYAYPNPKLTDSTNLLIKNKAPVYFKVNANVSKDYVIKPGSLASNVDLLIPHNKKSILLDTSFDSEQTWAYITVQTIRLALPISDTCTLKITSYASEFFHELIISPENLEDTINSFIFSTNVIDILNGCTTETALNTYLKKVVETILIFVKVWNVSDLGNAIWHANTLSDFNGRESGICISGTGEVINCAASLTFEHPEYALWPYSTVKTPPVIAKDNNNNNTPAPDGLIYTFKSTDGTTITDVSKNGTTITKDEIVAGYEDTDPGQVYVFDPITGVSGTFKLFVTEPVFDKDTIDINVGEIGKVNIVDPNGRTVLYNKIGNGTYFFTLDSVPEGVVGLNDLVQFSAGDTEPKSVLIAGLTADTAVVTATNKETKNVINITVNVVDTIPKLVLGCHRDSVGHIASGLQTIEGITIFCVNYDVQPLEQRPVNLPITFNGNIVGDLRFNDWLGWVGLDGYYPGPYVAISITADNVIVGDGASAAYEVIDKNGAWTGLGAPGSTLNINAERNVIFSSSTRTSNCGDLAYCSIYNALPVTVNIKAGGDVTVNIKKDDFFDASNIRATNVNVCTGGQVTINNISIGTNSINGAGCN